MWPSIEPALRPLTTEDLQDAAALFAAGYPERAQELERWPFGSPAWRWVATAAAELVGYAGLWRVDGDRFRMDLVVAAEVRCRGIGDRVLDWLVDAARAAGGATLQARANCDSLPALTFLAHRGFTETMRMHRAVLDVAGFRPPADASEVERRCAAAGIAIAPLCALEREDVRCWERLRDACNAARNGWPDPDPRPEPRVLSMDQVRTWFRQSDAELTHETSFVAVAGDRYIGFVGPLGTGVDPEFRNRGVATALKLREIAAAQAQGQTAFHSSSGNPAMLRVFDKLGYTRMTTEIRLVRRL
jgi:GNAT superfamily N-acetyltransferase